MKSSLAAYFSRQKLEVLNTVDNIPGICDVVVPDGWFRSARAGKTLRDNNKFSNYSHSSSEGAIYSFHNLDQMHQFEPSKSNRSHRRPRSSSQNHTSLPSGHSTSISPPSSPKQGSQSVHDPQTLVPLEYLRNVSGPRRNPIDEQLLKMFST